MFTSTFIPAGTPIWSFDPEVDWAFSAEDFERFPERYRDRIRSFCYLDESGSYILCGDNARYMNHSDSPNCDDSTSSWTVTLRDIEPHEELTCDYRAFDLEARSELPETFIRRTA